jgi:outer membrane lipoprotein SlyB
MGNNAAAHVVGAVGGAVVGAVAGGAIEEGSTRQTGLEYVVQTETGAILTLVQGSEDRLMVGDHVLVLYGDRARLIRDPSATAPH